MSTRRLEEILEECLAAYLGGRRTIEQSLSLYPADARELEPLLRTATAISTRLASYSPPAHIQQRGLNRFLSDARARRNLKALRVGGARPSRFAGLLQRYRLGFAAGAAAVLIVTVAVGSTNLVGNGSDGNVSDFRTATPSAVLNMRNAIDNIKNKGQQVEASDIERLTRATTDLRDAPPEEINSVIDTVGQQLAEADSLVANVAANQPDVAQQAQQAQKTIRNVAATIGAPLPTSPAALATTTPATATPEATPVETPAPTPTAEPTAEPTPTIAPAPSDTPPPRAPAGLVP